MPEMPEMPVFLAVVAAVVFGVGVAMQRHEATEADIGESLRPGLLLGLMRRPLWVAGFAAEIIAFGFQAAALRHGSLVLVQPILATPVVVALVVGVWWWGETVHRRDWFAVAAVIGGLAVFMVVSQPSSMSHGDTAAGNWGWMVGGMVFGCALAVAVGARSVGVARAATLGLAAGAADALMATLTKAFAGRLDHGIAATVRSWTPWAVVVAGIAAVLLTQSAYQAGHPTVSLPIITVVDPVVSAIVGITLFAERFVFAGAGGALAVVAALVVIGGLVTLCQSPSVAMPEPSEARA